MPMVYVKPSPGGRIRMPDRQFQPMKPEGSWVPRHSYYERLIVTGDLIISDPPKPEEVIQPPPTEPAAATGHVAEEGSAPSKEI
jgi:hypothetical protein